MMNHTYALRMLSGIIAPLALAGCATAGTGESFADNPEPGLQGQQMSEDNPGSILAAPYSRGVRVVGHDPIRGRDSNIQLVWVDHCAYVSSSHGAMALIGANKADPALLGVAVVDVSDPANPRMVRLLRDKGALGASETISAVTAPDGRRVLAAGAYANGSGSAMPNNDPAWLDIYDVSDCANPKLMAEVIWPGNSHTVTLSPDARYVYGTNMSPFTGNGGLQVMDISDMANPRFLGKFGATEEDGTTFEFASHEIRFSADSKRIYAGVNSSKSDHLNKGIAIMPPNAKALGPEGGGVLILDNSDFTVGKPDPKLRLVSAIPAGGWHSVVPARIGGVPYLVGGAELGTCPGTWPKFTNIANETKPYIAGEFRLAMNRPKNCPPRTPGENGSSGIVPSPGTATLHYNDVDSATDTRLGLFNFLWAGLRIVDLRDPANPEEIAYFKPGDACGGHVRYMPETGKIWAACGQSGFWVLELAPELRKAVSLPGEEKE
jgi:hypothetical protein